jgi:hypothetical protein
MNVLELSQRRERFRSEYVGILKEIIAGAEKLLARAAAEGVEPAGAEDLRREILECRRDLAYFSRPGSASQPRLSQRRTAK